MLSILGPWAKMNHVMISGVETKKWDETLWQNVSCVVAKLKKKK
jgi:hypothetical protein